MQTQLRRYRGRGKSHPFATSPFGLQHRSRLGRHPEQLRGRPIRQPAERRGRRDRTGRLCDRGEADLQKARRFDRASNHRTRGPGLAQSSGVYARGVALAVGIVLSSATVCADVETDRPVFVTVVGHGAIRFRLAAGATAPCDSSNNRMVFDGWLEPGRYEWGTGSNLVCFQNTSGAFRKSDWSEAWFVSTVMRHGRPTEIAVSTE
jgi:hypothetical protein